MVTTAQEVMQRTKQLLYSNGIGEKPVIIQGAADAAETISTSTVAFSIASGEASKVSVGQILATANTATETAASEVYVVGVNGTSDVITAIASYHGAPAAAADAYDDALFELSPEKSEFFIYKQINAIIGTFLHPDVYSYSNYTITPNQTTYQNELNAAVEYIESATQLIAGFKVPVEYQLEKNLSTSVSSTTVLASLYTVDGSSVYLTTRNRVAIDGVQTLTEQVIQCIATGAAALCVGATRAATNRETASKDSQFRGQRNPSTDLWRDFITLKGEIISDLSREVDYFEYRL